MWRRIRKAVAVLAVALATAFVASPAQPVGDITTDGATTDTAIIMVSVTAGSMA